MFLDYKFAYSTDSDCTELLDLFSPADALHIKYPLESITIIGFSEPMQNDHSCFYCIIILNFITMMIIIILIYNILNIINIIFNFKMFITI
jgi:hypothetical protein